MESDNTNKTYYPNSKVSEKVKQTEEYYKQVADYLMAFVKAQPYNDVNDTMQNLKFANGIIPASYFEYVMRPYKALDDTSAYPKDMKEFDLITPIRERVISEYIRLKKSFNVYISDPDITSEINSSVRAEIKQELAQEVINLMNEQGFDTGMPSKPTVDPEKLKSEITQKWMLEKGLDYSKRVKYLEKLIDAEMQYVQAFFYYWATEKVVTYRTSRGKQFIFEVINPCNYYRVKGHYSRYIEDDPAGIRMGSLSISDLKVLFDGYFDKKELDAIEEAIKATTSDSVVGKAVYSDTFLKTEVMNFLNVPLLTTANEVNLADAHNSDELRYSHIWYNGFREIGILNYITEVGDVQEMIVEADYILRPNAGDLTIRKEWVLSTYEQYVFTTSSSDKIYTKPRLINPQRELVSNMNVVKGPYNGIYGVLEGLMPNPIPKRCAPWNALYRIFRYRLEIAISEYVENIPVLPESLLHGSKDFSTAERLSTMKRDRKLIINDGDLNPNTYQYMKSMVVSTGGEFIRLLNDLCDSLRISCMDAANMNQQRYGDIGERAGKGTTEYAISNSALASILPLTVFNKFMEVDYTANVDHSKIAWIEGVKDTFVSEDGTINNVDINGLDHFASNIGISFLNSGIEDSKIQQYKDLAISYANSGAQELAIAAIDGESSYAIKNKIEQVIKQQTADRLAKEQADRQTQLQISENNVLAQREAQQYNSALQEYKEEQAYRRSQLEATVKLLVAEKDDSAKQSYANDISANLTEQEAALKMYMAKLDTQKVNNDNRVANRKLDIAAQQVAVAKEAAKNKTSNNK